jgi:hypothetical protein
MAKEEFRMTKREAYKKLLEMQKEIRAIRKTLNLDDGDLLLAMNRVKIKRLLQSK